MLLCAVGTSRAGVSGTLLGSVAPRTEPDTEAAPGSFCEILRPQTYVVAQASYILADCETIMCRTKT